VEGKCGWMRLRSRAKQSTFAPVGVHVLNSHACNVAVMCGEHRRIILQSSTTSAYFAQAETNRMQEASTKDALLGYRLL
jgi:hypothetical protein